MKKIIILLIVCLIPFTVFAASQSNSGKTAADIITEVRQILNESTASFWTDAILLDWIDAGTREIVAKTKCRQDTESITLVTGTTEYAWDGASEYSEILACNYYDGTNYRSLTKTDIQSIGRIDTTKKSPQYWYEWKERIGIWPVPTAPYNGKNVYIFYVLVPTVIDETTDNILTPAMLDQALVWYVVSCAKARDNIPTEAMVYMKLFNELITIYRQDILYKSRNQ